MSFEEKLQEEINDSLKIIAPNTKKTHPWYLSHLHADFIELKCLFWAKEEWLTHIDVVGHYKDSDQGKDEQKNSNEVGSDASDNDDRLLSQITEIFITLKERETLLKIDYPFDLDRKNNYIRLKTELNEKHLLYIKLLLDSNLNNFPKLQHILTKDFEKISANALKEYFPNAIIAELGKNSTYKGNTKEKIKALAKDLNVSIIQEEVDKLSPTATQEKGLDLLAFFPFEDKIASTVILLAQCACGKKWPSKTNETGNYESFLNFYKQKPLHSMFIPYYLSSEQNGFHQSESLSNKIVFERKRIIEFVNDYSDFKNLESYQIVQKATQTVALEV